MDVRCPIQPWGRRHIFKSFCVCLSIASGSPFFILPLRWFHGLLVWSFIYHTLSLILELFFVHGLFEGIVVKS